MEERHYGTRQIGDGRHGSIAAGRHAFHAEGSGDGGPLMISDFQVFDHRVSWSWLVFAVVTVLVWLLGKAVNHSSIR